MYIRQRTLEDLTEAFSRQVLATRETAVQNLYLALEFYIKLQGQRPAFRIGGGGFFCVSILSAQESEKAVLSHASSVCFPLSTALLDAEK